MKQTEENRLQIAILTPRPGIDKFRKTIQLLDLGKVIAESSDYPTSSADLSLVLWKQSTPDAVLVASDDPETIRGTVATLHETLPTTALLVISRITDPQVILDAIRGGAMEFLHDPVSESDLSKVFRKIAAERFSRIQTVLNARGKVYCVLGAKGGAGATTVAVNLAAAAAEIAGSQVSVTDLDYPLGNAGAFLNLNPTFSVVDAFNASARLDRVLLEGYSTRKGNISVLAGPNRLELTAAPPSFEAVKSIVKALSETYTHSFLDVPGHFSPDILGELAALCDKVLLVTTPELTSIWKAHRMVAYLQECRIREKIELVVNRVNLPKEIPADEIEKTLDQSISWTVPDDYAQAVDAIHEARPIVSPGNKAAVAESYRKMAQDLLGLDSQKKERSLLQAILPSGSSFGLGFLRRKPSKRRKAAELENQLDRVFGE
jgi:pilus assembly protein CpaE